MPRAIEPRPLRQHQLKTVFLRVPSFVWPMVSTARVSEFRAAEGNAPQLWSVPLPTLAVTYRRLPSRRLATYHPERRDAYLDYRVMVLQALRREALGAITVQGLAAAGYEGEDARARFRRDWTVHEKKRFEPLRTVFVYTVRPVQSGDLDEIGLALVNHLYGSYLEEAQERPRTIRTDAGAAQGARGGREAIAGGIA